MMRVVFVTVLLALLSIGVPPMAAAPPPPVAAPLTEQELQAIAEEAYVYGYPLVTMELTRRVMTNVKEPQGARAPLGVFAHGRDRLGDGSKGPINTDMLYSSAWLDLRGEPFVLTVPNVKKNYFLLTMLDGWTTVFGRLGPLVPTALPASAAAATNAREGSKVGVQEILISGPNWRGDAPAGMREFKCVTDFAWLIAQFASSSALDKEIHGLQDGLKLQPLSQYQNPYLYLTPKRPVDPEVDMITPIREQVAKLSAGDFFGLLAELLKTNSPVSDGELTKKLNRLGFEVGEDFDLNLYLNDPDEELKPAVAERAKEIYAAFAGAPARGLEAIKEYFLKTCPKNNGWRVTTQTGEYGANYPQRAAIAYYGLGAGRPQDFISGETQIDSRGRPLDGRYRYRVHFNSPPPVGAFWSLGVVDHLGNLVGNDAQRYSVGSREGLSKNGNGTVDLLIQRTTPGGKNWLVSPHGHFALVLRLYEPQEGVRDGSWKFPVVERID